MRLEACMLRLMGMPTASQDMHGTDKHCQCGMGEPLVWAKCRSSPLESSLAAHKKSAPEGTLESCGFLGAEGQPLANRHSSRNARLSFSFESRYLQLQDPQLEVQKLHRLTRCLAGLHSQRKSKRQRSALGLG